MATGMQWDALQVVAWSRMFADNARTMPVLAAVRQTFDAREMCGLCCTVQQAKREQRDLLGAGQGEGKAPLVLQPVARIVVAPPVDRSHVAPIVLGGDADRDAPPVPPPRARHPAAASV